MFPFKESMDRPNNYTLCEIALKSGFKFRDIENRRLDWKTLGCVDVNKVIENQDYEFLEKITPKIIEAPMQSILGTAAIDPAVSSLFRLAQMSLQYMCFCQQFMSHTLYDLRKAFNQIHKKHSNLKYNYKCLEEQHYKAQERIQSLLKEFQNQRNIKGDAVSNRNSTPSSLYPCDQCTKNFLTSESLKSHQQRKHSIIEEKHELSDDNEKKIDYSNEEELAEDACENIQDILPTQDEQTFRSILVSEKEIFQSNNNNDNESNANCTVCSQKTKINSSSVAVQVDEPQQNDHNKKMNDNANDDSSENAKEKENQLIQSAYETIDELKKEIVELKNSLETKTCETNQIISEDIPTAKQTSQQTFTLHHTNDKIDVIEQKFNAFETMYMQSQHQFIESFRNLDERQKVYMDNIQETIKEIVGKSMEQHDIGTYDAVVKDQTPSQGNLFESDENIPEVECHKTLVEQSPKPIEQKVDSNSMRDSSSHTEIEQNKLICQADVHTILINDSITSEIKRNALEKSVKASKDVAIVEFEQRLRQFGVDAESTGLSTPRSNHVLCELSEEREEMRKTHRTFEASRKKLKNKVDRIAKEKLSSASGMTSLSSASCHSDEKILEEDQQIERIAKTRPKSASVQKMRTRNAKKLMKKFVENDIDENDIIDKMQMAQKAINSHRECIQQLLHTTAHSPGSRTKIKNSAANETKQNSKPNSSGEYTEIGMNQYNKMPNVTTRRVVFVNLDEDS